MSKYANLIAELKELAQNPPTDDATREQLFEALRPASFAVEGRLDTWGRASSSGLLPVLCKVAADLGLFKRLAEAKSPQSLSQLAEDTGAQASLLGRILRYLAANGLAKESAKDTFEASPGTQVLAHPGFAAGFNFMNDIQIPSWAALPKYLAANGYHDAQDSLKTPFNLALNTDLHAFAWGMQNPSFTGQIQRFFSVLQEGSPNWLNAFPESMLMAPGQGPVLVDVGGGRGHQCALVKARYPSIARKIIVQDQPHVITDAVAVPGVEAQAYDFFTPQPIKDASLYYIKSCLHDWSDEKAVEILQNQKSALSKDSVILIDEMILPNTGVHWQAANMDWIVIATAAARERTEDHWRALVESAGLVVKDKYLYNERLGHGVLVAGLP